jgi:PKD repeat protein
LKTTKSLFGVLTITVGLMTVLQPCFGQTWVGTDDFSSGISINWTVNQQHQGQMLAVGANEHVSFIVGVSATNEQNAEVIWNGTPAVSNDWTMEISGHNSASWSTNGASQLQLWLASSPNKYRIAMAGGHNQSDGYEFDTESYSAQASVFRQSAPAPNADFGLRLVHSGGVAGVIEAWYDPTGNGVDWTLLDTISMAVFWPGVVAGNTFTVAFVSDTYYGPIAEGQLWVDNFSIIPLLQYTASPTNGLVALTVQFSSPSVDSDGNDITSWNWSFGDGSTSTAQNPSYTYTNAGVFCPSLIATNNLGNMIVGSGPSITVSQATIQYTASPTNGLVALTVQFSSPSVDSDGNDITSWNWSFGDGSTSSAQNPSYTYTNAGVFYPSLIATNNLGNMVIGSGPSITASQAIIQHGSLKVTIMPSGAITAGAQWQVDGGTWQISGTTVTNLSVGNHTVSFSTISDWTTPANKTISISDNSTTTTNGTYVAVTNQLQIRAIGLGTVSPNYSNAWLNIGQNYSITSAPAAGFVFTNWIISTNWVGGTTLSKTNLQFMMASNLTLQVNFLDVAKPTLSITNLTAGQRVSNSVFIVKGKASDNWKVGNVVCQINGGGWNSATNINNWTNWAAGVTLTPGTNFVQAFAVDTTGNVSTTNSVSFQFVVTNQLQIHASGLGTISPNYSNAWLEIGRNYSITSSPASGFVFTNWVASTNWIGGTTTTKTNLTFMMASNLTLQVNFLDVTKPTLTITTPTAGQHMTNALATVVGTASDNWKVSAVWYQVTNKILTGGTWTLATTANNYTNWTTIVTLAAGTNTVKAYAVDLGGNYSTTSSVSVLSSNTFKLQLNFAINRPLTSTGLNFTLQISSNLNGHLQFSTNLLNWATLTNFVGTNTTLNFRDPAATNSSSRFYRAVIP